MSENVTEQPPLAQRNPWPRVILVVLVVAVVTSGAAFVAREALHAPEGLVERAGRLISRGGAGLRRVAEGFRQGTVRTEFVSQAAELAGTSRVQFATLKQNEVFRREETGTTAWGWIPLPKVVVQAQAPVDYGYYLDFGARWEFLREDDTVKVFAPPIEANPPAMDVSALKFYTLEGSVWRDEQAVHEKLRQSLTGTLRERSVQNITLVREVGRKRLEEFVEKWLAEKFTDGARFHVKVIFPDEQGANTVESRSL